MQEGPVSADAQTQIVGHDQILGNDRHESRISDADLRIERGERQELLPVLGAVSAAVQSDDHRVVSLQKGKLARSIGMVRQLVIRKDRTDSYIVTHKGLSDSENSQFHTLRTRPCEADRRNCSDSSPGLSFVRASANTASAETGPPKFSHSTAMQHRCRSFRTRPTPQHSYKLGSQAAIDSQSSWLRLRVPASSG